MTSIWTLGVESCYNGKYCVVMEIMGVRLSGEVRDHLWEADQDFSKIKAVFHREGILFRCKGR